MDVVLTINVREDEIEYALLRRRRKEILVLAADHLRVAHLGDPTVPEWREGFKRIFGPELAKLQEIPAAVVIGIPRSWVFFKFVDLPPVPETDLARIMQFEADRHLPFALEDLYYSVQRAAVPDAGTDTDTRALVVAAKRSMLNPLIEVLEELGLPCYEVRVSSLALPNLIFAGDDGADVAGQRQHIAIIDHRDDGFELTFFRGRTPLFSRHVAELGGAGGGIENVLSETKPDVRAAAQEVATYLSVRISETLSTSLLNRWVPPAERTIDRIVLLGEGAPLHSLRELLEIRWHCPVQIAALPDYVRSGEGHTPASTVRCTALGLGVLRESVSRIDLMPEEHRVVFEDATKFWAGLVAAFVVWFFFVLVGYSYFLGRNHVDQLQLMRESWSSEVTRLAELNKSVLENTELLKEFREISNELPPRIDAWLELTKLLPMSTWLHRFTLEGDEIQIEGETDTASTLPALLDASPYFAEVEPVGSIRGNQFKLQMRLVKPREEAAAEPDAIGEEPATTAPIPAEAEDAVQPDAAAEQAPPTRPAGSISGNVAPAIAPPRRPAGNISGNFGQQPQPQPNRPEEERVIE